jgi:hypothetical protein
MLIIDIIIYIFSSKVIPRKFLFFNIWSLYIFLNNFHIESYI